MQMNGGVPSGAMQDGVPNGMAQPMATDPAANAAAIPNGIAAAAVKPEPPAGSFPSKVPDVPPQSQETASPRTRLNESFFHTIRAVCDHC